MDKKEILQAVEDQLDIEDIEGNVSGSETLIKVRDFLKSTVTMEEIIDEVGKLWFGSEGRSDPDQQGYIALCLAGEVGELCNYIKKELRSSEFREDKSKEIEMEIPDIVFYLARLIAIRKVFFNKVWHIKMNHNEIKYGRPITDRPFHCKCERCMKKLMEATAL